MRPLTTTLLTFSLTTSPLAFAFALPPPAHHPRTTDCQLPAAGNSCSGAALRDVIVHWNSNTTQEHRDMFLRAAKGAGGEVRQVLGGFGFTAYIPEEVVALMVAFGESCGVKVGDNGCAGIPWCGEAPC